MYYDDIHFKCYALELVVVQPVGILEKTGADTETRTDGQFFADSFLRTVMEKTGVKHLKARFLVETSGVASAISEGDILMFCTINFF